MWRVGKLVATQILGEAFAIVRLTQDGRIGVDRSPPPRNPPGLLMDRTQKRKQLHR